MENKNKVSVIIPCYNDGEYLQEAVESVEKCDKQLYEIIIVDDGSIDNLTKKVLSSMKKKVYRVLKIDHKGPSAARNFGVKHAKFSYLLFLWPYFFLPLKRLLCFYRFSSQFSFI